MIFLSDNPIHVGTTLTYYEHNGYDDSDWYAEVWDTESGKITKVLCATTRYAMRGAVYADATPDVLDAAEAWIYNQKLTQLIQRWKSESTRPVVGQLVKIVKTRGKNKGAIGKLVRTARSQWGVRGCVELPSGEQIWDSLDYIQAAEIPPMPLDSLECQAKGHAMRVRQVWETDIRIDAPKLLKYSSAQ